MKKKISKCVAEVLEGISYDEIMELMEIPPEASMGDFALPCFGFAKIMRKNPAVIAAELKNAICPKMTELCLAKVENVGVGAVIFHDLFNQRIKNVDFSWDEVLSFEGTTGPYVQYTYARAKSILQKNGWQGKPETIDYTVLTDDVTYSLIKILAEYEDAVHQAAKRYEPSVIARYVISVASAFNKFYHECPILHAVEKEKQARLRLVNLVQGVLRDAGALLGMSCPEKM